MTSTPFLQFAEQFAASNPSTDITGEYYDLPGQVVYRTATHKLAGGGRIEVNTTTPDAPDDFEWKHEITINDKQEKQFIHLIVRHDASVAETYGKKVLPVHKEREVEIMGILRELLND